MKHIMFLSTRILIYACGPSSGFICPNLHKAHLSHQPTSSPSRTDPWTPSPLPPPPQGLYGSQLRRAQVLTFQSLLMFRHVCITTLPLPAGMLASLRISPSTNQVMTTMMMMRWWCGVMVMAIAL
jgi:hypothetical protein